MNHYTNDEAVICQNKDINDDCNNNMVTNQEQKMIRFKLS